MKDENLSINSLHVTELNNDECKAVNGGSPWIPIIVSYVVLEAALNPKAHWDAFKQGFEAAMQ